MRRDPDPTCRPAAATDVRAAAGRDPAGQCRPVRPDRPTRRRAGVAAGVATLLTVGLGIGAPQAAAVPDPEERKQQLEGSITDLEEALEGTSAELQGAYTRLRETQAQLPAAQAALRRATERRDEARRKDAELATRLAAARETESQAAGEIESGTREIETTQASIGRIASGAYRGAVVSPSLSVALDAGSPDEFATRFVMVDTAFRSQSGTLARLNELQALRGNQQARLEAVRAEVDELKQQAAANLEEARAAQAEADAAKAQLDALAAQQSQAAAEIEARKAAEMQRLDQEEQELRSVEAELRRIAEAERRAREQAAREQAAREKAAREAAERREAEARAESSKRASRSGSSSSGSSSSGSSSSGSSGSGSSGSSSSGSSSGSSSSGSSGGLSRPSSGRISSGYGYRIHPIYGTRKLHSGTDFAAPCGTPVKAAASGSVVSAGGAGSYGNRVVLSHGVIGGTSLGTTYSHLSSIAVRGGSVSKGQVVGYIGTTGTSTGCHLHFEVFANGSVTDPMKYL